MFMKKLTLSLFAFLLIIPAAMMMTGCGGDEGLVLAKVDGEKIYAQDINDIFARNREVFSSFDEELQWRKTILDSLIIQQLLIKEAYKKNIDESEEVNRIVLGNRDQFLLDVLYMRKVSDLVDVTAEEIKDYYSKLEYKVRASHILVDNEDTANMIIDSLQAGSSFENLAVKYSRDGSAQRNRGDLGYFIWGQMDPVFQEQVFKLNPGETSAPFQTKYGWHIVKMVDRTPNELRGTYDKMYDQIRTALENQKRGAKLEEYRAELMQKYPITVDTITCQYLMHKRAGLYPPSILETLPKNDFDLNQLDRDEKELILASWDGGQMALGQYLVAAKKVRANQRPDFDDYDLLGEFIFNISILDILSLEARRQGLEDDHEYKRKIKRFKELAMADIMENDSLQVTGVADDGELLQYYEDNPSEFNIPGKIHLYEIMFNDYNMATTYVNKIGNLNKFKALASQYTERSGKRADGGDLGWVDERMYPRLYTAAENADIGKIIGPIPVGGKHSIIYVAEKHPPELQDFDAVKPAIQDKLNKLRRSQAFEEWVKEQRKSASIKIYENNIRASIDKGKYPESSSPAEADTTQG